MLATILGVRVRVPPARRDGVTASLTRSVAGVHTVAATEAGVAGPTTPITRRSLLSDHAAWSPAAPLPVEIATLTKR